MVQCLHFVCGFGLFCCFCKLVIFMKCLKCSNRLLFSSREYFESFGHLIFAEIAKITKMSSRTKQTNRGKKIAKKIEVCELALSELYEQRLQLESEYQKCLDAKNNQVETTNSNDIDIKYEEDFNLYATESTQLNSIDILTGIMNYEEPSFSASNSANTTSMLSAKPLNLDLNVVSIKREFEEENDEDEVDIK